jgi:uncharacterized membrane protein
LVRFLALNAIPPLAFIALAIFGGWWPIVGFSAGVFVALALVLYGVMAGGREREVVTVTPRRLIVESGRERPRTRIQLDRYWTRIEPRSTPRPALALISRGTVVEIAAALGEAERKALARRLRALVGPDTMAANPAGGASRSAGDTHPAHHR